MRQLTGFLFSAVVFIFGIMLALQNELKCFQIFLNSAVDSTGHTQSFESLREIIWKKLVLDPSLDINP